MITRGQLEQQVLRSANKAADGKPIRAVLGDFSGVVSVPNKRGYVYCLLGNVLMVVRNTRVQPVPGLPVLIQRNPVNRSEYEVLQTDYDAIVDWDGEPYGPAPSNTFNTNTYADQQNIIWYLPRATNPETSGVIIPKFWYYYDGVLTEFVYTVTSTLLGVMPAANKSAWVCVSFDPSGSSSYTLTKGSDFDDTDPNPAAYFATVPAGQVVLGDVRIEEDSTVITQGMIWGERRVFLDASDISTLNGTGVANEVAFFSDPNTLASSPRITREASGNLLTVTGGATTDVLLKLKLAASHTGSAIRVENSAGDAILLSGPTGTNSMLGSAAILSIVRWANAGTLNLAQRDASGVDAYLASAALPGNIVFQAYNGTALQTVGSIAGVAAEAHGLGALGTYIRVLTTPVGSATAAVRAIFSANGNLLIGTTIEAGASATRTLGLLSGTAPSANVTNMTQVYSNDVNGAGDAGLHVRTEGGDIYKMGDYFQTPGGRRRAFVTKTANYTATANDDIIYCNSASAFTITLPAAASNSGMELTVKNQNTGVITVDANSSETIDDATTQTLNQYDCIVIHCDGTEWWII